MHASKRETKDIEVHPSRESIHDVTHHVNRTPRTRHDHLHPPTNHGNCKLQNLSSPTPLHVRSSHNTHHLCQRMQKQELQLQDNHDMLQGCKRLQSQSTIWLLSAQECDLLLGRPALLSEQFEVLQSNCWPARHQVLSQEACEHCGSGG